MRLVTSGKSRFTLCTHVSLLQEDVPLLTEESLKWQVRKTQKEFTRALTLPNGAKMQYTLADRVLRQRVDESPAWHAFVGSRSALQPLHVVVYYDEVVPGNVIAPDNARRSTLFYFSFLEFLDYMGHSDAAWITLGLLRTTQVELVPGGLSEVTQIFMPNFLEVWHEDGLIFVINDKPRLVRVHKEIQFLGDIAGHKYVWGFKGSSGLKQCRKCSNVVSKDAGDKLTQQQRAHGLVDIAESDASKFVATTNQEIWDTVDHLQAIARRPRSKTKLGLEQKLMGWKHIENGLLQNVSLRAFAKATNAHVDRMHTFYSNGISNKEIGLFLDSCGEKVPEWSLQDFVQYARQWRRNHCIQGDKFMSAFRLKLLNRSGPYAGSASQCKCVVELLAAYGQTTLCDIAEIAAELTSLAAHSQVLREVSAFRKGWKDLAHGSSDLHRLQQVHMQAFVHAYGKGEVLPKHHEQFHLLEQLVFVDCFATERKNKVFKEEATFHTALNNFEAAILPNLLLKEAAMANTLSTHATFVGQTSLLNSDSAVQLGLAGAVRVGYQVKGLPRVGSLRADMCFLVKGADAELFSVSAILRDTNSFFCLCDIYNKVACLVYQNCTFVS